ncbi:MAG: hypothetical protein QY302_13580 [Anaerolineales bacterium]|nr:MAG: hypothetical protein QY302_13580 [Anaerolineales bacterium]
MRVVTAALAIAASLIVLLGFFLPVPLLINLRAVLTDWAVVIGAIALLVGIFNLVAVQLEKIRMRQKGSVLGVILILSLLGTFGYGLAFGVEDPFMQFAMDAVIVPVEAALMAILAITLVYACIRLFRQRLDWTTVLFLLSAVLLLIAIMPKPFDNSLIDGLIVNFTGMLSRGGARGLLIGIALGTLLTGLRILFGIDRPYGGN